MASPKIFVFGSLNGQLQAAFAKLTPLHKKNNFSLAIVAGNFFSDAQDDDEVEALLAGRIEVPVPTYFTVGTTALPARVVEKIEKDEEIAPNVHYLGKRSVTKTSEGVRIVTLGGLLDDTIVAGQSKEQYLPYHTVGDAKSLVGANKADVLLTTIWPSDIWMNSAKAKELGITSATGPSSTSIAELCGRIKPRYHFAMSPTDICFEREPFFPDSTDGQEEAQGISLTRFISLAPFANPAKAKAMFAFTLNREAILTPPAGSTLTPFAKSENTGKKRSAEDAGFSRFATDHQRHDRRRRHRERSPPPGPDRCFFCLSNPNFLAHMVFSVGNEAFAATAKGPLTSAETFKEQGLDFPAHLIVTPIAHSPTLSPATMSGDDAVKAFAEMNKYREVLQGMIASKSNKKLGAVTWEISRARNIHVHWQILPVPADMVSKGLVEAGFRVLAEDLKLPAFESNAEEFTTADQVDNADYFRLWIWAEDDVNDKVVGQTLVMKLSDDAYFDLQYPRKVMAKLLGLEERLRWQDVVQTEAEETADVEALKVAFKAWDFTQ
ncbi:Protein similar to CwfJ C-terminus 1 domain containing protein [Rhypophila sp. PSN 637]